MKKLIILLTTIISFGISESLSQTFQFENYEWGISKDEAIKQVMENGYTILDTGSHKKDGGEGLMYEDSVFHSKIRVFLTFSPITKKLCSIMILSDDPLVGDKLKPILSKKYGNPNQNKDSMHSYDWKQNGQLRLGLYYNFNTMIIYYPAEYYSIYEKEEEKLNKIEVENKF